MEIKKIVEGMTAPQVAKVIEDNFNEAEKTKADKTELSELGSEVNNEISSFKETVTNQINNYKPIEIHGDVTNAADEEDITSDENNLLKLKDRNNLTGMGYVILRKDKSFAEQLTQENTIYEIRYDFDLNNENVALPYGCVLLFNGGRISNGIVECESTIIRGEVSCLSNIVFSGTIVNKFFLSWVELPVAYTQFTIRFLHYLSRAAQIVWDAPTIWLELLEGYDILVHEGVNDFNGTKFNVKNVWDKSLTVFSYKGESYPLNIDSVESLTSNAKLKNTAAYVVLKDNTPLISNIVGMDKPFYRNDILCVKNNILQNDTILPYDDSETQLEALYFTGDYNEIRVKNALFVRDLESNLNTILNIENAHDVTIEDITIKTPDTELWGGEDIKITNCYNVLIDNVNSCGSFSVENHYGYVYNVKNIYNLIVRRLDGMARWGIIGGNSINRFSAYDSTINRIDCHCYSKDFFIQNCSLKKEYTRISVHQGFLKYDCCSFKDYYPINRDGSYPSATYFKAAFENCNFDVNRILNDGNTSSNLAGNERREILQRLYSPSLRIVDSVIDNSQHNTIIYLNSDFDVTYKNKYDISLVGVKIKTNNGVDNTSYYTQPFGNSFKSNNVSLTLDHVDIDAGDYTVVSNITGFKIYDKSLSTGMSGVTINVKNSVMFLPKLLDTINTYTRVIFDNCKLLGSSFRSPNALFNYCHIYLSLSGSSYLIYSAIYNHCIIDRLVEGGGNLNVPSNQVCEFNCCEFPTVKLNYASNIKGLHCLISTTNVVMIGVPKLTSQQISDIFTKNSSSMNLYRFQAFDTDKKSMVYYLNKNEVDEEAFFNVSYSQKRIGTTNSRPSEKTAGFCYFDTQINKPIWWTGDKWVDATGADV